ncbi:hypothetical protein JYT31_00690 [Beggiatoa alba]|nr:hypothetical protein [Beggiatoa alba]
MQLSLEKYRNAVLSNDANFDGEFFVASKERRTYCRPTCTSHKFIENQSEFFLHAHLAAISGYRPCEDCHPGCAPDSSLWTAAQPALQLVKRNIECGYPF